MTLSPWLRGNCRRGIWRGKIELLFKNRAGLVATTKSPQPWAFCRIEPWHQQAKRQRGHSQKSSDDHCPGCMAKPTPKRFQALMAAAQAGLGFVAVPLCEAQALLADGRLVQLLPQWRLASMPMSLVYPYSRRLSARVRAFTQWATVTMGQDPLWALEGPQALPSANC